MRHAVLGLALVAALVAGAAWVLGPRPASSAPSPTTTGAPPATPPGPAPGIFGRTPAALTGAVGRVALGSAWYYKADPANVGLARRWRAQRFQGRRVQVPYVPNAWPVT
ncbi:MAG: hypothetical protein ACJ77Z_02690, partial [Thermoleophilaceae bacterium]